MADIKKYKESANDWLLKESNAYIEDHICNMIAYSEKIKAECANYKLPYIDTSHQFTHSLDKALKLLLATT